LPWASVAISLPAAAPDHYAHEQARERVEIASVPDTEAEEVREIFQTYGLTFEESASVVASLRRRPKDWVTFMMRFELGLEAPGPSRAWKSALTLTAAYIVGGLIPLSAYLLMPDTHRALQLSVVVTLISLAIFGGVKGLFTGVPPIRSGFQTTVIGGLAAAAAFAIAHWIG
jgi:vacuolar iron transporter family protein